MTVNEKLRADNPEDCRICGAPQPHRQVAAKGEYRYVQCGICGVVRQYPYPSPAATAAYYERYQTRKSAETEYLTDAGYSAFVRDKRYTFSDLGLATDAFEGKSVCDVGCATGQFVQMMADAGASRLFGIDIGEEGIRIAQSRKLNCIQGDFLAITDTFDVMTMWHVVEHLPDPQAFIRHAYNRLSKGGWFLVETPVHGPVAEAFGDDWRFFMPVEHLNLFTQNALFRVCRDAGFTLKNWVTFGSGNDSGVVPPANKRAMDTLAKRMGIGDVLAAWFVK